jgi:hypothetical protein
MGVNIAKGVTSPLVVNIVRKSTSPLEANFAPRGPTSPLEAIFTPWGHFHPWEPTSHLGVNFTPVGSVVKKGSLHLSFGAGLRSIGVASLEPVHLVLERPQDVVVRRQVDVDDQRPGRAAAKT